MRRVIRQIMLDPYFQTTRKFYALLSPSLQLDNTTYGFGNIYSPVIAEFEVL